MVKKETMDFLAIKLDLSSLDTDITTKHSFRKFLSKFLESCFPRGNNLLETRHQLCFPIPPVRNGVVMAEPWE